VKIIGPATRKSVINTKTFVTALNDANHNLTEAHVSWDLVPGPFHAFPRFGLHLSREIRLYVEHCMWDMSDSVAEDERT